MKPQSILASCAIGIPLMNAAVALAAPPQGTSLTDHLPSSGESLILLLLGIIGVLFTRWMNTKDKQIRDLFDQNLDHETRISRMEGPKKK